MNLEKIKRQWEEYNEEFDSGDYMDIDTHTSMALQVGGLIKEIEKLQSIADTKIWQSDIESKLHDRLELLEDKGQVVRIDELSSFLGWLLCGDDY